MGVCGCQERSRGGSEGVKVDLTEQAHGADGAAQGPLKLARAGAPSQEQGAESADRVAGVTGQSSKAHNHTPQCTRAISFLPFAKGSTRRLGRVREELSVQKRTRMLLSQVLGDDDDDDDEDLLA
jgi:hypothetical protein